MVGLHAIIPSDAFTAETLGTERAGNGVLIRENGVVLTIGYLITEAETVWLHLNDGRVVPGHVLGYDQETGFGLVQALAKLDLPALPLGNSTLVPQVGEQVVVGGAGGRQRSVAARIVAQAGIRRLLGIRARRGDLHCAGASELGRHRADRPGRRPDRHRVAAARARRASGGPNEHLNMVVPIDDLKPILDDLLKFGRPNRPPRPWLGLYATEIEDKIVVVGLASRGPAQAAEIRTGDIILAVAGREVSELAAAFRKVWSLGNAGVDVPLLVYRDGRTFEVTVKSGDRTRFLKGPSLH